MIFQMIKYDKLNMIKHQIFFLEYDKMKYDKDIEKMKNMIKI